jgi:fimbrial chaperone protein
MASTFKKIAIAACCALALMAARAGEFSVSPIRLELGAALRSGVITVRNEEKEKLSFQLQAMEWTQDEAGKDHYEPSDDIVFFPKLMTIEPGQEGIVRVGAKRALLPTEKTYRLFIEELPGPPKPADPSAPAAARINVLVRFGAPIFVTPATPQDGLDIQQLTLVKGSLRVSAKNTGNRHQIVQGVKLRGTDGNGQEVYALSLADRYLLSGTTKSYTTSIAAEQCAKIVELFVEFATDKLNVKRKLEVSRAMCP